MAIERVDLPIKNGGSFHSYVSLPDGYIQSEHESSLSILVSWGYYSQYMENKKCSKPPTSDKSYPKVRSFQTKSGSERRASCDAALFQRRSSKCSWRYAVISRGVYLMNICKVRPQFVS